ncbi:S66 peptidase family protein [Heliophilum fasciatum]|uniref:Muramoyltetrapeptide carboxypeptidase n=1 Tax=Heliophilum fasciatum TaxID=35700 RepID=A0A4R2RQ27_9FIRM|nr:LD-carboxypeptidase [Heliophilum fasciatum]MCW2277521.1 muramoyltetrapeptide carboxypeptidase [Heliophilum fasciatum]TCP65188.1 muramoyltetrapeptide carboxypeptidase [Heliophilum fasciatum]
MATRPPILRQGDTFGIVTLGSPLAREMIDARVAYLESFGFNVVLGRYVYGQAGFLAATAQQRAGDLMDMFRNRDVNVILPTRGGVGVAGILPFLDYAVIRSNPKILSGYSDVTILLNTLYQQANLITFHSLLLIDFRPDTPPYNYNQFYGVTATIAPQRQVQNPPGVSLVSVIPGNVTGPIVGGNLTSLVGSLGTAFEIDTRGKIFFLEETHEPINRVYRYLEHLRLAGKFRDCIGIIMGECTNCADAYGKTYSDLIRDEIVPLRKPLMTNLASGHGLFKAAIPIGAVANLNTLNNTLTIVEPTVSAR